MSLNFQMGPESIDREQFPSMRRVGIQQRKLWVQLLPLGLAYGISSAGGENARFPASASITSIWYVKILLF